MKKMQLMGLVARKISRAGFEINLVLAIGSASLGKAPILKLDG